MQLLREEEGCTLNHVASTGQCCSDLGKRRTDVSAEIVRRPQILLYDAAKAIVRGCYDLFADAVALLRPRVLQELAKAL